LVEAQVIARRRGGEKKKYVERREKNRGNCKGRLPTIESLSE